MKKENENDKIVNVTLDDNQLDDVNGGMKIIVIQEKAMYKKFIELIMKIKKKKQ